MLCYAMLSTYVMLCMLYYAMLYYPVLCYFMMPFGVRYPKMINSQMYKNNHVQFSLATNNGQTTRYRVCDKRPYYVK